MDGYRVYKLYMALKLHFHNKKYDVFTNKGNIRGSREKFYTRNDVKLFEKLADAYKSDRDIVDYFVANFSYGHDATLYSRITSESYYTDWNRVRQSMHNTFKSDLATISLHLEKEKLTEKELYNFNGVIPELMKMVLGEHVHVQTVCILDTFKGFFENWNEKAGVAFEEDVLRIPKTKGFVKFDKSRFAETYKSFNDELIELNTSA